MQTHTLQSQEMNEFRARELRFLAAETTLFPFELAFVIMAKLQVMTCDTWHDVQDLLYIYSTVTLHIPPLQVLHRMQRVASARSKSASERTWFLINRLFLAVVLACLLLAILGNFVAVVSFAQAADLNAEAAAAWSLNNTLDGSSLEQRGRAATQRARAAGTTHKPVIRHPAPKVGGREGSAGQPKESRGGEIRLVTAGAGREGIDSASLGD